MCPEKPYEESQDTEFIPRTYQSAEGKMRVSPYIHQRNKDELPMRNPRKENPCIKDYCFEDTYIGTSATF